MNFKKITIGVLSAVLAMGVTSCSFTKTSNNQEPESQESEEVGTYTIYFYYNNSIYETRTLNKGDILTDVPSLPEVKGYTLSWNITDFSNINANTNVYAVEEQNEYTISFYLDGVFYSSSEYHYNDVITAPSVTVDENKVFYGWENLPSVMPDESITIYGKTIDVSTTSKVISFYVDGELYVSRVVESGSDLTDIPLPPTKEGYTYTWEEVSLTNITEDVTVNAVKTINSHTITYYLNNELYQTQNYNYGESILAPDVTTEEGYIFNGWSQLPTSMPDSDLVIYGTTNLDTNDYDISKLVSGQIITITNDGDYTITGTNTNVSFVIEATGVVNIELSGVNVTNLRTAFISNTSATLNVKITGNNSISDSLDNESDAMIYSEKELSLSGTGNLNIVTNTSGILTSKCNLNILSGTYEVSAYNAIQAKGKNASLKITDGKFTLTGTNSCLKAKVGIELIGGTYILNSLGDGINTDGSITINDGTFNIEAINDGIQGDGQIDIIGGNLNVKSGGGYEANSTNTTSSNFVFEVEDTSAFTTDEEYYGLYVLIGSTYTEIDETNYSTYKSYTTFYDRSSAKGIKSDGVITISGGTIILDTLDDGIKSDTTINISAGNITSNSSCDGIQADTDLNISGGILNVSTYASYYSSSSGKFILSGNTYVRTSSDSNSSNKYAQYNSNKALKSDSIISITGGEITINSSNDGVHSNDFIEILGGTLNISALDDGVHADTSLVIGAESSSDSLLSLNVVSSYEGLEAGAVYINSGVIDIVSSDDGINAGGGSDSTSTEDSFNPGGGQTRPGGRSTTTTSTSYILTINGGNLTINAAGDGLDSNGSIYINGGKTIVYGPTDGGNGAIDYGDSGSDGLIYTGGVLVAIGTSSMAVQSTSGPSVMFTTNTFSSGTSMTIKDSSGTVLFTGVSLKSGNNVVFMSDSLTSGSSYTLTYGNSSKTASAK